VTVQSIEDGSGKLLCQYYCSYLIYLDTANNNEGFKDSSDRPHPLATPREKYLWGILKGRDISRRNVIDKCVNDGRGRSAFAAKSFYAGDFVCKYRGFVQKTTHDDWGDKRNASLDLGSYCYDVTYNNYVIDVTASINDPGRYIDHASKNYNLQTMPPVQIEEPPDEELRVGFVAIRDIKYGEDLFFNYGIKALNGRQKGGNYLRSDRQQVHLLDHDTHQFDSTLRPRSPMKPRKKKRKPANRTVMECSVPGCLTRNVSKLVDYIGVLHSQFDEQQ